MGDSDVDTNLQQAEQLLNQTRILSGRARAYQQRVISDSDSLAEEVVGVQRALQRELKAARPRAESDPRWEDVVQALERATAILCGNGPAGDLRRYAKVKPPFMLSLMLGSGTNVVALRKDQTKIMKANYHRFRNRAAYTMFAFAFLLSWGLWRGQQLDESGDTVTLKPVMLVGVQLFLCWMLFYFVSSALRESVLKMNGSNIRPWWIRHHYWAACTCSLLLSLPVDSPTFQESARSFLIWPILQSIVIIAQNRYQRRRMYTRIALGKNTAMDVVAGDAAGAHGQLLFLIPLLFLLQALQIYIGLRMVVGGFWAVTKIEGYLSLERRDQDLWVNRGFFLVGLLMIFMAVNNLCNTIASLPFKSMRAKCKHAKKTE